MVELIVHAPAVHTWSRTRLHPSARSLVIDAAAQAAMFNPRLLPVIYDHRVLAWVGGEAFPSRRVHQFEHKPWMLQDVDRLGRLCGWTSVDELINDVTTNGQLRTTPYSKAYTTSPTGVTWQHLWGIRGSPPAGVFAGTAYTATQIDDTVLGALPNGGNVTPATKHLISCVVRTNTTTGVTIWMLYDMVLRYDNCAMGNTLRTLTNGVAAARYIGTGEPGLQFMGCMTDTTTANGLSAVNYVDNGGNAATVPNPSQVNTAGVAAAPLSGTTWPTAYSADFGGGSVRGLLTVPLAAGDLGVRSITDYQYSGAGAGEIAIILGYPIAYMPCPLGDGFFAYDFVKQIASVPRVYDGAALTFAVLPGTAPDNFFAMLQTAWG